jgi:glycosyltransferase involved in cell wall biosynthesis
VTRPFVSVVIPVFNNESSLEELTARLSAHLGENKLGFEIIYVDDSSSDRSLEIMKALGCDNPFVKYVSLSSNIGQQRATLEGLEKSIGDQVVVMDADLQDQPELIARMSELCASTGNSVFILRKGAYQSLGRMLTSRLIKITVQFITSFHHRAGSFYIIPRASLGNILAVSRKCTYPYMSIIAGTCSIGVTYLSADRLKSVSGSRYSSWKRLRAASRAIYCALYCARLQPVFKRRSVESII